jgi:ribosomal protein S18 acetylase RimI-like enzyme
MTSDDFIGRADKNLIYAVKSWAAAADGGVVREADGLVLAASGVPLRSFNNVFLTRALAEPSAHLREAITHCQRRRVPFRLRVLEPLDGSTEAIVSAAGFERAGGIPCLVLSPSRTWADDSGGLVIRRVIDDDTLRGHTAVVADAFGWPPSLLARVFTRRLMAVSGWRGYVGYLDGRPVATAQLFVTDGVAGIYYVGTLEAHRRRGFAESITRQALNEGAAAGCDMASLQASPSGQAIYERMGFSAVSYYRTYVPVGPDVAPAAQHSG